MSKTKQSPIVDQVRKQENQFIGKLMGALTEGLKLGAVSGSYYNADRVKAILLDFSARHPDIGARVNKKLQDYFKGDVPQAMTTLTPDQAALESKWNKSSLKPEHFGNLQNKKKAPIKPLRAATKNGVKPSDLDNSITPLDEAVLEILKMDDDQLFATYKSEAAMNQMMVSLKIAEPSETYTIKDLRRDAQNYLASR